MPHYQHKAHDSKTGRFIKTKPQPHAEPLAPQASAIESQKLLSPEEQERDASHERFLANTAERAQRAKRARQRATAPDWDQNPRDRTAPATGPDGAGSGNLGF